MSRSTYFSEDPEGLYKVLVSTGEQNALAKTLAFVLGTECEDPEVLVAAVHAAVLRARIPAEQLEELRTQLQLCNLAALTGTDITEVERNDPAWSEAYENTKALHRKYRATAELYESLPWPVITAYEFWAAVKKELTSK